MATPRKPLPPGKTVLPHPEHPDLPHYARPAKGQSFADLSTVPGATPSPPPRFSPGGSGLPGRPSRFTPEILDEILDRVAAGEKVYKFCDGSDPRYPKAHTVYAMAYDDNPPGFAAKYQRARRVGLNKLVDRMVDEVVVMAEENPKGAEVVLKARSWEAKVTYPQAFGDRQTVAIEDPRGELAKLLGVPRESIPE